jgi:hypothetical protein
MRRELARTALALKYKYELALARTVLHIYLKKFKM